MSSSNESKKFLNKLGVKKVKFLGNLKFSETENKLIMRTEEEMMPWDKLEPLLTEISKNGTYTNTEELYKLIKKIVPEFKTK